MDCQSANTIYEENSWDHRDIGCEFSSLIIDNQERENLTDHFRLKISKIWFFVCCFLLCAKSWCLRIGFFASLPMRVHRFLICRFFFMFVDIQRSRTLINITFVALTWYFINRVFWILKFHFLILVLSVWILECKWCWKLF